MNTFDQPHWAIYFRKGRLRVGYLGHVKRAQLNRTWKIVEKAKRPPKTIK